jgi:ribosome biogenesis protein SSF1/2
VGPDGGGGTDGGGEGTAKIPRSIVFRRGKRTEAEVGELVQDVRHLMAPFTALNLQENRQLTLSQYAKHLALPMGVTHMLGFSQNDERLWLKLVRTPEGPTLTFRVHQFTLRRHIVRTQRRPVSLHTPALHANPPIVVTNNFEGISSTATALPSSSSSKPHLKLLRITFQNLFPATNVHTVKLRECKRLALFHYDPELDLVEVRHYAISSSLRDGSVASASAVLPLSGGGISSAGQRRLMRIVSTKKKLPNLSKLSDIADLLGDGFCSAGSDAATTSDSELDDDDAGGDEGSARASASSSLASFSSSWSLSRAIKLKELGPRLTLKLVKVERGLGGGDVLYHAFEKRSPEESAQLKERKQRQAREKEERRATQQANVNRKRAVAEEKRLAKRQRQQLQQQGQEPGQQKKLQSPQEEDEAKHEDKDEDESHAEVDVYEDDEYGDNDDADDGDQGSTGDEDSEGSDDGQE